MLFAIIIGIWFWALILMYTAVTVDRGKYLSVPRSMFMLFVFVMLFGSTGWIIEKLIGLVH